MGDERQHGPELREQLRHLQEEIVAAPARHTVDWYHGARVFERMLLADGNSYYIRVAFHLHPKTSVVTIIQVTVTEASGPH